MSLETFTMELRVDHTDKAKDAIIADLIRQHCKSILSSAMLLADNRAPQISLMSSNMFEREKEINLADEVPADTYEAPSET